MAKKKRSIGRILLWSLVTMGSIIAVIGGYTVYKEIYAPNTQAAANKAHYIYIPTGSMFDDVQRILQRENVLKDASSFAWVAKTMHYASNVKPGRYLIRPGMSNRQLISMLRLGLQTPVELTFANIHSKQQLAVNISSQIEASSGEILTILNDPNFCKPYGLTPDNVLAFFIPNTYEMYWNTSAQQFINRMKTEYNRFWTPERKKLAATQNLSRAQVYTLASIVQMETARDSEKPIIAGVYMNRLNKNWLLQADPTVVYATGDFSLRRVFSGHREIDSPYNTYKYKGLPPGPICLASASSLDAVLHYTKHNYMYFCAKDDFSGYHAFAVNDRQQLANAQRYHEALDRRNIR